MIYPDKIKMEEASGSYKRTTLEDDQSTQKKSKGAIMTMTLLQQPILPEFWYGFSNMETLAYEVGMPPIINKATKDELIAHGYNSQEATELTKARMSFPQVPQKLWQTMQPDNIVGQHFNLIQIPFDVEVNMHIQLAFDYYILLHFEKPTKSIDQKQAMTKVLLCFQEMNISICDSIAEPVAILYHGPQNSKV